MIKQVSPVNWLLKVDLAIVLEGSQEDTPSSLNLSLRGNSSIGAVQELLEQV